MSEYAISLRARPGDLLAVLADLAETTRWRPELSDTIRHFVFTDGSIRAGLYSLSTKTVDRCDGSRIVCSFVPSDRLTQFAHAVSNGVVPFVSPAVGE